jgi:hypothetical protein
MRKIQKNLKITEKPGWTGRQDSCFTLASLKSVLGRQESPFCEAYPLPTESDYGKTCLGFVGENCLFNALKYGKIELKRN